MRTKPRGIPILRHAAEVGVFVLIVGIEFPIGYVDGSVRAWLNSRMYPSGGYYRHVQHGIDKIKQAYPDCAVLPQKIGRTPDPRAWVEKFNFVVDCNKSAGDASKGSVKMFRSGRPVDVPRARE